MGVQVLLLLRSGGVPAHHIQGRVHLLVCEMMDPTTSSPPGSNMQKPSVGHTLQAQAAQVPSLHAALQISRLLQGVAALESSH